MTNPTPRNGITSPLHWANAPPPAARPSGKTWELIDLRHLSAVRHQARSFLAGSARNAGASADRQQDAVERAVTALDELASNALRHGRPPTSVELFDNEHSWLIVAVDTATTRLPVPATGRPEGQGGYGMYLIADFALAHGTHVTGDRKRVWAQLPKG